MKSRVLAIFLALAITFSLSVPVFAVAYDSEQDDDFSGVSAILVEHLDGSFDFFDFSGVSTFSSSSQDCFSFISAMNYNLWGAYSLSSFDFSNGFAVGFTPTVAVNASLNYGLSFPVSAGDVVTIINIGMTSLYLSGTSFTPSSGANCTGRYQVPYSSSVNLPSNVRVAYSSEPYLPPNSSIAYSTVTYYLSENSLYCRFIVPDTLSSSSSYCCLFRNANLSYGTYYSVVAYSPASFSAVSPGSISLPAFALDSTLSALRGDVQSIPRDWSKESTSQSILSAIRGIQASVTQQSPMDKFESDYIENFSGQLSGTEKYLGNGSPVLPDNFVSSSGGQSSVVDGLTSGMGLSTGSLNMSDFSNATGLFSGSDAIGVGGPWEFFTQGVADSMVTGGAVAVDVLDPENELLKWLEDMERRNWLDTVSP